MGASIEQDGEANCQKAVDSGEEHANIAKPEADVLNERLDYTCA